MTKPVNEAGRQGSRSSCKPQTRPPAFVVPGAPKEPLDEITLTARAQKLDAWLAKHPQKTDANVQHWLYQHAWIVDRREVRLVERGRGAEDPDPRRRPGHRLLGYRLAQPRGRRQRPQGGRGEDAVSRVVARLDASHEQRGGITLAELLVTMVILGIVLAGLTGLFSAGLRAETDVAFRLALAVRGAQRAELPPPGGALRERRDAS